MTRNAGVVLLGLTMCGGASLFAQGPGGQGPQRPVFLALDADHDGVISAAEMAAAASVLAHFDTDGDGQLTSLEYLPKQIDKSAADPDAVVARFMLLDRNGDGVLTIDEIPERMQAVMAKADTNHDGKLTKDELRVYALAQQGPSGRPQRVGQATRMDPILNAIDTNHDGVLSAEEIRNAPASLKTLDVNGDGQLTADETRPRQQTAADRVAHMLEEWDTNKDGKIAKAEAPDRMQEQFATIDTNGDGFLDVAELTVYFEKMSAGRGGPGGGGRGEGGRPPAAEPKP